MKTCRKDFQGRKSTTVLKLLCRNIAAGRFNWRRYCTPQTYFGQEICVTPLHCSYGQIGYTVHFPYSNMPEVEYDWEMGKLTVDEEKSCRSPHNTMHKCNPNHGYKSWKTSAMSLYLIIKNKYHPICILMAFTLSDYGYKRNVRKNLP